MISKDSIKTLLLEGRRVDSQSYFEHCGIHHVKTFYFSCERLIKEPVNVALSSTALNEHVLAQLRAQGIDVNNQFNPQGWFGKAWTDWKDPSKNETNFKSEYCDVLDRTGNDPYSYRIKPECFDDVVEIL